MLLTVNIRTIKPNAIIPKYATLQSAGADLYACLDEPILKIAPNETILVPLGFQTEFDKHHAAFIYARSSVAHKQGLAPSNCVGIIDADYRGEWMVSLHNSSKDIQVITDGQRIAQVIFKEVEIPEFVEVTELPYTHRTGGFGSTGTH